MEHSAGYLNSFWPVIPKENRVCYRVVIGSADPTLKNPERKNEA